MKHDDDAATGGCRAGEEVRVPSPAVQGGARHRDGQRDRSLPAVAEWLSEMGSRALSLARQRRCERQKPG